MQVRGRIDSNPARGYDRSESDRTACTTGGTNLISRKHSHQGCPRVKSPRYRAHASRALQRKEANVDEPVDISILKTRVRQHREKLGISLRAAAADCDVPFNTLARVEKGYLPDLANFRRIVTWLGLAPEQFFQPPRVRTENTPEIIAHHLSRDPNLSDTAAGHIAALVHELYSNLARPPRAVQVRLRAAPTFKPEASQLLDRKS